MGKMCKGHMAQAVGACCVPAPPPTCGCAISQSSLLQLLLLNARAEEDLSDLIMNKEADSACITETWVNEHARGDPTSSAQLGTWCSIRAVLRVIVTGVCHQ